MQHLDEGTIHAWLDGELPEAERAAAEAHVAQCAKCAAAVAEARGFVAASSRILTALDAVPSGVLPSTAAPITATRSMVPRAWMAVAAVLVLGIGTVIATRSPRDVAALRVAETRQEPKPAIVVPNVAAPATKSAPMPPTHKPAPTPPMVAQAPAERSAPATIADTMQRRALRLNQVIISGAGTAVAMDSDSAAPQVVSRNTATEGTDSTVTTIYTVHGARVALIERASRADLQRAETSLSDALMAKARVPAPAENSITWSDSTGRTRTLRGAISQAELERLKARLFGATP